MTYRFCDFLGDVSGWRPRCLHALEQLALVEGQRDHWKDFAAQLLIELSDAKTKIRQLELLVPRPAPPKIDYIVERDSAWMQRCIDSMGLGIIRVPLDGKYWLTDQANTLSIIAWDWCNTLHYVKDLFDCENFAILFKAFTDLYFQVNHVGIVLDYQSGHAYNLIVYPDGNKSVLEPQHDTVFVWTQRPEKFYPLTGAILAL